MFFSQYSKNYATASIFTFIVYVVFSILGGFEKGLLDYMPGRLMIRITEIILESPNTNMIFWTSFVTVLLSVILFTLSIRKFNKYDL
jgi:hypothetical protein